jgi:hypothetical protein
MRPERRTVENQPFLKNSRAGGLKRILFIGRLTSQRNFIPDAAEAANPKAAIFFQLSNKQIQNKV